MHPPEPIYPCCLPALGEFYEMAPHEGLATTLAQARAEFEPAVLRVLRARAGVDSRAGREFGYADCRTCPARAEHVRAWRIRLAAYGARLERVLG